MIDRDSNRSVAPPQRIGSRPTTSGATRHYRLFGEVLATDANLSLQPLEINEHPTVTLAVVDVPPRVDWSTAAELVATPPRPGRTRPDFRFFHLADRDVIRIEGGADFHLLDEQIVCHLFAPDRAFLVEILLTGLAFSFWLERRGVPTLHGSAASIDGAAVGFIGAGGVGKSSLVTHLTAMGHPLVTEDLLVLFWSCGRPQVHSGVAQLRLWPEQAALYVDDWEQLERPHPAFTKRKVLIARDGFGSFADGPVPLNRLYVLDRLDTEIGEPEIIPLPAQAALRSLLQNSYLPKIGEAFGWQRRRLEQLTDLLAHVPVSVLRYPSGFEHLDTVRTAIGADLSRTPQGLR
jgi:hypothetical protein